MKILLTGAQGQLGQTLQATCPDMHELIALDKSQLDITCDVTQATSAIAAVQAHSIDVVINAAAYTNVDQAETEPAAVEAVNVQGAAHLAMAAKEGNARLIHLSTDYVFAGTAHRPYRPTAPTAPQSVYGDTKLRGEQAIQTILPDDSLIFRTAWVYSPFGHNFLHTMLKLMNSDREQLGVIADQVGTPTSTFSLAALIWQALAPDRLPDTVSKKVSSITSGIYHWTDQGVASWYDFAVAIQEEALALGLLNQAIPIRALRTEEYPTQATRPAYSILDKRETETDFAIQSEPWRVALRKVMHQLQQLQYL